MTYDYTDFSDVELIPQELEYSGEIYILVYRNDGVEVPFYVGQSRSFHRRMDDYFWGQVSSPTDHKIRTAIDFLCKQGGKVFAKHKRVADPLEEEKKAIAALKTAGLLLNGRNDDVILSCLKIVERARTEARKTND